MELKDYSDLDLIHALRDGHVGAMDEIFRRYWRKLLAVAYNHTKDKSSAQDIVQEIFIKLWDRRERLEIDSLNYYLSIAVKYSVYNYLCRERRHVEIEQEKLSVKDVELHDEEIYSQFLKQQIDQAVETLPDKCKLVFKYSRYEGKSVREISDEMEISEKTVEAHITKALKTLKLSLKHAGWITTLAMFLHI